MEQRPAIVRRAALALAGVAALAAAPAPAEPPGQSGSARMCDKIEPRTAPVDPPRVVARFMGATAILIDDGTSAVMTDPFFTRDSLLRLIPRRIEPDENRWDAAMTCAAVDSLSGVLVTHAHYDHILDAPAVANRFRTTMFGSESSRAVAVAQEAHGEAITAGQIFAVGAYKVTAIATRHGFPRFFPGRVRSIGRRQAHFSRYREGDIFSFLIEHRSIRIIVHPGTEFLPEQYRRIRADVVFMSTAWLQLRSPAFARQYFHAVVSETGARLIIPVHWDNLFSPLRADLAVQHPSALCRMKRLADEHGVAFMLPPVFSQIRLDEILEEGPPPDPRLESLCTPRPRRRS